MYQVCLYYTVDHYESYHTIGGVPQGGGGRSSCLLTDQHHMIKYSTTLHIPLWIAYRMNGPSKPVCPLCKLCEIYSVCCCYTSVMCVLRVTSTFLFVYVFSNYCG